MMGIRLRAAEYERTCTECGYTWRVPRAIARRGIHGMSAMTFVGATRERGFGQAGGRGLNSLAGDIAARAETMEGFRICSKCGIDKFTQLPVRGK
jgi:hypothetical protein